MAADPLSTRERPPLPVRAERAKPAPPSVTRAPVAPDLAPIRMTVPLQTPTTATPAPTPEQVSDQATAAASGGALAPPEDDAPPDGTTTPSAATPSGTSTTAGATPPAG
jgi:hypothetical protein